MFAVNLSIPRCEGRSTVTLYFNSTVPVQTEDVQVGRRRLHGHGHAHGHHSVSRGHVESASHGGNVKVYRSASVVYTLLLLTNMNPAVLEHGEAGGASTLHILVNQTAADAFVKAEVSCIDENGLFFQLVVPLVLLLAVVVFIASASCCTRTNRSILLH